MSEQIVNDEKDNVIGREYGVEKINEKDKNFRMLDYIWIFFAAGDRKSTRLNSSHT